MKTREPVSSEPKRRVHVDGLTLPDGASAISETSLETWAERTTRAAGIVKRQKERALLVRNYSEVPSEIWI